MKRTPEGRIAVSPVVFTDFPPYFQQKLSFVHRKSCSFSFRSSNNIFITYTNGKIFKILFAHDYAKNTRRKRNSEEGRTLADKKSFLLYFDMFPCICELPVKQQGLLFSAIFRYADAVWRNNSSKNEILQEFPEMHEATRMAFSFVAETIRRDTEKWQEKQTRYQKAASERWEKNHRQDDEAWIKKYL